MLHLLTDRQDVGEQTYKSAGKLASLLSTVVKNANTKHQAMLVHEIRLLPFHPSRQVKKEMKGLVKLFSLQMTDLALSYAEASLEIACLRPQRSGTVDTGSQDRKQQECMWQEEAWRGTDSCLLQGAMCVPTRKCLASASAEGCTKHGLPRETSHQHLQHLALLLELGKHEHFLQLMAFQLRPQPCFYITENVKDRRLISLLIDKRTHQHWMNSIILLQAALQIVKALVFLAQKGIALRDVTTYNMIYVIREDKHGRVKEIQIKLAHLGLADAYMDCSSDAYENREIRTRKYLGLFFIKHPINEMDLES